MDICAPDCGCPIHATQCYRCGATESGGLEDTREQLCSDCAVPVFTGEVVTDAELAAADALLALDPEFDAICAARRARWIESVERLYAPAVPREQRPTGRPHGGVAVRS